MELAAAPLARAGFRRGGEHLRAAAAELARSQAAFVRRLAAAVPDARVGWRYGIVLDGLAVTLPRRETARLARLPGVRAVYPSVRYHALRAPSGGAGGLDGPLAIGATELWGPRLAVAGQSMKIGIVDEGVDQRHPYLSPTGFVMPDGYPLGNRAYTTARVIVARAFPPPGATWKYAGRPFDPQLSYHGTHVAGIAAGGPVSVDGDRLSGVAPRAYIGNYKALTVPAASGVGLDGNSPELVAAIEAAVADGMDVINLSLGEPEVAPSRDAVARAIDGAAAAGVVPVVAAGNSFEEEGDGSIGSPGSARSAITVAATDRRRVVASFSSAGPTPLGLLAKPDVAAPGVDVVSSLPPDGYGELSGTSMAAPHVAGAAALLLQLHPDWTPAEVKSALVQTAGPALARAGRTAPARAARAGGGFVDLVAAADPRLFAAPAVVGLGFLDVSHGGLAVTADVVLSDAGGGAGSWEASVRLDQAAAGVVVGLPATVAVPGTLTLDVTVAADAREGDRSGLVVLRREGIERHVPFWLRVTRPRLGGDPARALPGPGAYAGDAARGRALVGSYRYPSAPSFAQRTLRGPEAVFRVTVPPGAANLGAAVLSAGRHVLVEPRIVAGTDENRLGGVSALPVVTNPYLVRLGEPVAASGVLLPDAGLYSVVFDTPSRRAAGRFRFRLWIDDTTPPDARLLSRTGTVGGSLRVAVSDAGAGVDPRGLEYRFDRGPWRLGRLAAGGTLALLPVRGIRPGRHRLVVTVADRQEAKNDENVAQILPNTRTLRAVVRIR